MHPVKIALACAGVTLAATFTGILLGPALGALAAAAALTVGLVGGLTIAYACWRSCHVDSSSTNSLEA